MMRRQALRVPGAVTALIALGACQALPLPALRWPIGRQTAPAAPVAPEVVAERAPDPLPPDPEPAPSDSAGLARLLRLAEVWHTVAVHHPWVAERGVAWDSATVIAVHRVRAATTDDALQQAYGQLLNVLHDPLTRLVSRAEMGATPPARTVTVERLDSVRVLHLPLTATGDSSDSLVVAEGLRQLPARMLLDVRGTPVPDPRAAALRMEQLLMRVGFADSLIAGTVPGSAERVRRIGGESSAVDDGGRMAGDGWVQRDAPVYVGHARVKRRIVALVDSGTVLPPVLLAMQMAGQLTIVADGGVRELAPVTVMSIPISTTHAITARLADRLAADGRRGTWPDTVIRSTSTRGAIAQDVARDAALAVLRAATPLPQVHVTASPIPTRAMLPAWQDTVAYPYLGARVLAGFRIWSAMRARFVHRDLMDDDLDAIFARVLPRLEAARSTKEYAAALADLTASLDDSEGQLRGASMDEVEGVASLPLRTRYIDGRILVMETLRDPVVAANGITTGTEIVAVDGFPAQAWLTEHRRLVAASNDWSRAQRLMTALVRGPVGDVLLRVRDVNNRERTITMPRRVEFRDALPQIERPTASSVRAIGDGMVYLDLERVTPMQIDSLRRLTTPVRGVILDLRGPLAPSLAAADSTLLPWLATRSRAMVARIVHRVLQTPCDTTPRAAAQRCADIRESRPLWQTIDTSSITPPRVVALIDERTQGAAERLVLQLEAFANVTLVGSTTAGAVSPVDTLTLPGTLHVGIAQQEWRRADGSQLQRVGISPLVDVRPSVRGVRAGEDEVLTRAVQWLQQRLEPVTRRRR